MRQFSILLTVLGAFLLSVLAAPLPSDQALDKRSSGRGTWYYTSVAESACGTWNNDAELIVAASAAIWTSTICGQSVSITANGVTVTATVADKCASCGPGDLDMSPALFEKFAALSVGVLSIQWGW